VLIIAEDPVAREVYRELFTMRGHDVETAACARTGILHIARRPDLGIVVLALSTLGAVGPLKRKLHSIAPSLRIHVVGLPLPTLYEVNNPVRQRLH
jgi:hypothetical protein